MTHDVFVSGQSLLEHTNWVFVRDLPLYTEIPHRLVEYHVAKSCRSLPLVPLPLIDPISTTAKEIFP